MVRTKTKEHFWRIGSRATSWENTFFHIVYQRFMSGKTFCQAKNEFTWPVKPGGNKKFVVFWGVFLYSSNQIPIEKSMSLWRYRSSFGSASPDISWIAVARPRRWACHLATGECWFRGVPQRYVAGANTRGRQERRVYPWSQQVF